MWLRGQDREGTNLLCLMQNRVEYAHDDDEDSGHNARIGNRAVHLAAQSVERPGPAEVIDLLSGRCRR